VLHVNIPPEFEQYGIVRYIAGRVDLTCGRIIATVPWLGRTNVVQHLCVFTIPKHKPHKCHIIAAVKRISWTTVMQHKGVTTDPADPAMWGGEGLGAHWAQNYNFFTQQKYEI